jgi:uncharacterized protein YhaN
MAQLGFDEMPSERHVVERLNQAARDIARREEYDRIAATVAEAERRVDEAGRREMAASSDLDKAKESTSKALTAWIDMLESFSLNTDLEPTTAIAAVGSIRTLRERALAAQSLVQRIRDITDTLSDIETRLAPIIKEAGLPSFRPEQAIAALEQLEQRYGEHQDAVRRARWLEERDREWEVERCALMQALEENANKRRTLLEAAGVADEDTFRELAEQLEKRRNLEAELDALHRSQPSLIDPDEQSLRDELVATRDEEVKARAHELADEIARAEDDVKGLYGDLRSLQDDCRRLEESNPASEIQLGMGELHERVCLGARQWAVLTIARTLLDETKNDFQQERQAPLLKTASGHLARFTGGRYVSVQTVLGEDRVEVVEKAGRTKDVTSLSRGTAEQLYLALRFALVDEYTRNSEPMPVVMDDVMVNFDPVRLIAVCHSIIDISKRHQVLVLTCHPHMVVELEKAAKGGSLPRLKVVEL